MSDGGNPLRGSSVYVLEQLRDAITSGTLRPGSPIRQRQIADQFKLSHIPVREALWQLESEGLVVASHNRGMTVASLTEAEALELTEFRALLEEYLTRRCVPRLSDTDLAQAEQAIAAIDRAQNTTEIVEFNSAFHRILYQRADAPHFLRTVEQARVNLGRYLLMTWRTAGQTDRSQEEHRQILEACRRGDAEEAGRIMATHVRAVGESVVRLIREQAQIL
ncbi:GntR family transcriptional regulator [Mesorhizobium sp. BE184]|uniref:GntR family transcriptional regulator n=1 Tax=Mesorhizobium sp. BE184 TaxID=2817714 RepID=UPI00285610E5|nr:GntR family transcriptional regulator [Mesorhizobium sp. BE184]MDR7034985.1 DNA-binding GntR family transcriptional regulator [Mesorhizobium sp. BE184]